MVVVVVGLLFLCVACGFVCDCCGVGCVLWLVVLVVRCGENIGDVVLVVGGVENVVAILCVGCGFGCVCVLWLMVSCMCSC